jgi:signal transduction histidine kinase
VSRTDAELVADALDHLRVLRNHLDQSSIDDQTIADAVSLRLAAAIESVSAASHDLRDRLFGDLWPAM